MEAVKDFSGCQKALNLRNNVNFSRKKLKNTTIRIIIGFKEIYMGEPQHEEVLFGRIAMVNGYISREQLIECLTYQAKEAPAEFLGDILLEHDYIDLEQVLSVLLLQQENLERQVGSIECRRRDILFGNLCIKKGFVDKEDIYKALRQQAVHERDGEHKSIGQILMDQEKLTEEQVAEVLEEQKENF